MAEEEKQDGPEAEAAENAEGEAPKKKKTGLLIGGGAVAVLALAFAASIMAVPSKPEVKRLKGPLTSPLTEGPISVNLRDNQSKRYLKFKLHCEYYAFSKEYFASRLADPLYFPRLTDSVVRVSASRSVEEVTGKVNQPQFLQELVEVIDTDLFPVHIGKTTIPSDMHEESGLKTGFSASDATFRGYFYEHVLIVDATKKTIQLDADGPVVSFEGTETDLEVESVNGKTVYVDVTELDEGFVGEVQVGVFGTLHNLLVEEWILQ